MRYDLFDTSQYRVYERFRSYRYRDLSPLQNLARLLATKYFGNPRIVVASHCIWAMSRRTLATGVLDRCDVSV